MVRSPQSAPILALVGIVAVASALVSYFTPAALLPKPERPFAGYGRSDIRIGGSSFPREAIGADDVRARLEAAPRRLVSQAMSTDEYLYAIVPPERVVGVSESAYREAITNVYDLARRHRPIVAHDPEQILRIDPHLVFTPAEARPDLPGLLRAAGVPVYRIHTMFPTLASIEAHIRRVGYLSGEDARAEAEAHRFHAIVQRVQLRFRHALQ
jgi:ABC-type hemin transport system substrate-binding protein